MSKQDENSFYTPSSFQVGKGEVMNGVEIVIQSN